MSNPFAKTFEELRSPFLQEKMAKKDYDGDGKIETGTQEYMGSRDKAIKKAMGKDPKKEMKKEHHQKDADGKVIEHGDGTPASVPEAASITAHDVNYGTKAGKDFMSGARNKAGELKYKLKPAGGLRIKTVDHYEPAPVKAPHFSDWKEEMHWEALKGKKLDIDDSGNVKNKIEINPEIKTEAAKAEVKKPKKAQDAGARGRRLLKRREYAAKISGSEDRVPDDLRDSVQYEGMDDIKSSIKTGIKKAGTALKNFINKPIMKDYPTQKQYQDAVKSGTSHQYQSYEPEGEMIDEMGKDPKKISKKLQKPVKDLKDFDSDYLRKNQLMPGSGIDKKFGEEYVDEAKIDKIDPKNKRNRRNVAKFGKQTKPYDPPTKEMKTSMGKFMQKTRQDMHKAKRGVKQEEVVLESDKKGKGSGTKDACYHKVKARYSVWPSAYASGALVKCRKKGAKNWGNSSKKEEVNWDFEMKSFGAYAAECWKTHKQVGTKMKGGKVVPNCVPKNEELQVEEKKKLSNTSPLSDRVSNWSKTKIKEGAGVKRDQNMPYIPNQKIKTVKDKPLKKVPYGALAQSYVPQGETIDEKRKFSGMGELAKKYGLDPSNANDYMKLKNMMRKGLKRNIQDRLAPPEV